jgi:hypothetical protein
MPTLIDIKNDNVLENITEDELEFLDDNREGYFGDGSTYYISREHLEILRSTEKHEKFIDMLLLELGERDDMEIISSIVPIPPKPLKFKNPVSITFLAGTIIIFLASLLLAITIFIKAPSINTFSAIFIFPLTSLFNFIIMLVPNGQYHDFYGFHLLAFMISVICFFISSQPERSTLRTMSSFIGSMGVIVILLLGSIYTVGNIMTAY